MSQIFSECKIQNIYHIYNTTIFNFDLPFIKNNFENLYCRNEKTNHPQPIYIGFRNTKIQTAMKVTHQF